MLLFSRMDTRSAQFIVGEFDGIHFTPESLSAAGMRYRLLRPQTFLDGKGRRLMIGWLYNWDRKVPEGGFLCRSAERPYRTDAAGRKGFSLPAEETQSLLRGRRRIFSGRTVC